MSVALVGLVAEVAKTFGPLHTETLNQFRYSIFQPMEVFVMLLWKTAQSTSVGTEIVRRPLVEVRYPPPHTRQVSRALECEPAERFEMHDDCTGRDDEERYIFKMVLMMLLVLVVPAILMLLYVVFNPDSFQYEITPKQDY